MVDDTESTIVCRHVHNTENPKSCTMQNMQHAWCFDNTWLHDICLCQSSQTIKFRPGQKATARAASNDIDRPKPDLQ